HTTSYGIELPPPEDGKESLKSLDAIGSHCMREIKKIQPEGPYILAGFSFGGVVAYETARKIHEKDGSINTLLMFDTFLPVPDGKNTIPVRSWPWFKQMLRLGKLDSLLFLIRNTLLVNLFWRWGYLDGPERPWNRNPGTIEAGTPPLNPEAYPFKEPGDLFPFNLHLFTVRQSHFTRKGVAEILNWNNYGPENLHHTWVKTDYHLRILDDEHLDSIRDSIFALHASK
ncbi:MAG: hypothetical protein KJT03_21740, partial [Verrucomicrobiae bacterium]|nr:hypothetical protein [Verrucomicrobiae bacterium]